MTRYEQYIREALENKHGKLVKLTVERHLSDIDKSKNDNFPYVFDVNQGLSAVRFMEICRHHKGKFAGQRFQFMPFQVFSTVCIFGWREKSSGLRRYRRAYTEMARKNAKTTLAALRQLYHLIAEKERGSQGYCFATKEEQAKILFDDIKGIIASTPELAKLIKVFQKSVVYRNGFIKVVGADSKTQDGFDPSFATGDEVHEHRDDKMVNVMQTGMGARQAPFLDLITTAGFNQESFCYSYRSMCLDVLNGTKQDERLYVIIHSMDESDSWEDESSWYKANPGLDSIVSMEYMRDQYNNAKNLGGSKIVDFLTKNLNTWTQSSSAWIELKDWDANTHGITFESLEGKECYGGLDLAKTNDLNAFCLYFPEVNALVLKFWITEEKARKQADTVDYVLWNQDGYTPDPIDKYVEFTPGNFVDHEWIWEDIQKMLKRYNVKSIAFDRYLTGHTNIIRLQDAGVELLPFGQGFVSMSHPSGQFEQLVTGHQLEHFGNPVMRWMIGNVEIVQDPAGNIKPTKGKNRRKRIDGVVAAIMAIGNWIDANANKKGVSWWDDPTNDPSALF